MSRWWSCWAAWTRWSLPRGSGEHAASVRRQICEGLEFLGVELDLRRNEAHAPVISRERSAVTVRVLRTDEDLMIARHTRELIERSSYRSVAGGPDGNRPDRVTRHEPTATRDKVMTTIDAGVLKNTHRYWQAANYLTVGQIYLQANPLLREPLWPEHIKRACWDTGRPHPA